MLFLGWQHIYNNNPYEIIRNKSIPLTEEVKERVLGGEAAMWSEQV